MPVTLAQAMIVAPADIDANVIDEFAANSWLLANLTFDDAVTPTGDGTLAYGYNRVVTPSSAAFRAINSEYAASEAAIAQMVVYLKIFGGKYQVDRVIANMGGIGGHVAFQQTQKIEAAVKLFNDTVINGDSGVNANAFDGLDKAIAGTTTESGTTSVIDLSTAAAMAANHDAAIDEVDGFLATLSKKPTALMGNSKLMTKIRSVARRSGYYDRTKDDFGRTVETYNDIALVDLGLKPDNVNPVVPIVNRTVSGAATTGLTDLYAVNLGLDTFHGVTMATEAGQPVGSRMIRVFLPNFDTAGAVKDGEAEVIAAVALRATKSAGVRRNFKIQ